MDSSLSPRHYFRPDKRYGTCAKRKKRVRASDGITAPAILPGLENECPWRPPADTAFIQAATFNGTLGERRRAAHPSGTSSVLGLRVRVAACNRGYHGSHNREQPAEPAAANDRSQRKLAARKRQHADRRAHIARRRSVAADSPSGDPQRDAPPAAAPVQPQPRLQQLPPAVRPDAAPARRHGAVAGTRVLGHPGAHPAASGSGRAARRASDHPNDCSASCCRRTSCSAHCGRGGRALHPLRRAGDTAGRPSAGPGRSGAGGRGGAAARLAVRHERHRRLRSPSGPPPARGRPSAAGPRRRCPSRRRR